MSTICMLSSDARNAAMLIKPINSLALYAGALSAH
jgi:hypothetical protein